MDMLELKDQQQLQQQQQQQQHTAYYSKEIEEEVDKCIQGLFGKSGGAGGNAQLSVEDFVSILNKLKDSQDKKVIIFLNGTYIKTILFIIFIN